tara:strand:- start:12363 stop:13076 length:714 start_codon:yes stop_codon:yes gene_type:complete
MITLLVARAAARLVSSAAKVLAKPKFRLRFRINEKKIKRKVKLGSFAALHKAGSIIRRNAKKQFSVRKPRSVPLWKQEKPFRGNKVVSMRWTTTKEGKVTSWRPKVFLKSKIFYNIDRQKVSAVIGPDRGVTKVNKLQEYGGSDRLFLQSITKFRTPNILGYTPPANLMDKSWKRGKKARKARAWIGIWVSRPMKRLQGPVLYSNKGKVPSGRFMKKGLRASKPKIPPCFRNKIRGP